MWFASGAEGGAEIHQRLVEVENVTMGQDGAGYGPKLLVHRVAARAAFRDEHPEKYACDVGVEDGRTLAEREAHHRGGRIGADAFERPQRGLILWQPAAVSGNGLARNRMQPARPDVVAERIPGLDSVADRRVRERLERRVTFQPFLVFGRHPVDLRLLKHDL